MINFNIANFLFIFLFEGWLAGSCWLSVCSGVGVSLRKNVSIGWESVSVAWESASVVHIVKKEMEDLKNLS